MSKAVPGVCEFCGGTPEAPGGMPEGQEFAFLNPARTRCNKPGCVRRWEIRYDQQCKAEKRRQKVMREMFRRPRGRRKWRTA